MSLLGRAKVHGSVVDILRPTTARNNDGSGKILSTTYLAEDEPCLIESLSDDLVQKLYGAERVVKDRCLLPNTTVALQAGDVVVVTAGKRVGRYYWTEKGLRLNDLRTNGHWDMPLVELKEAVPLPA